MVLQYQFLPFDLIILQFPVLCFGVLFLIACELGRVGRFVVGHR